MWQLVLVINNIKAQNEWESRQDMLDVYNAIRTKFYAEGFVHHGHARGFELYKRESDQALARIGAFVLHDPTEAKKEGFFTFRPKG